MLSKDVFESLEKIRLGLKSAKNANIEKTMQALKEGLPKVADFAQLDTFYNQHKTNQKLSPEEKTKLDSHLLATLPHANTKLYQPEVYARLLPVVKLMYSVEQNGIAEEHAYKLSVLFDDENKALKYLSEYIKQNPNTQQLMHDACLFALPQGEFDINIWRKLCAKFLTEKPFRDLILPQAADIEALIKNLAKDKKPPTSEAIKKATDEIKEVNVKFKALRRHHATLSPAQEKEYQELLIELSEKRMALTELSVPFTDNLTLIALEAYRERSLTEASAAFNYFLSHGLTKKDYIKFVSLKRQDDDIKIPNLKIDGATIGYPGHYVMKIPVLDEAHAARAACLGKLTGCCQSQSGEAGEPCVIHGLTSPNGGFYVLCQGDSQKPQVSDELLGQCWAWRSKKNALVFDSIEISATQRDDATQKMLTDSYRALAKELVIQGHTHKVSCGKNSGISEKVGIPSLEPPEQFVDYQDYSDSNEQLILFNKNKPFYYYGVDKDCTTATEQMLTEIMVKPSPLVDSTHLQAMLNWALVYQHNNLLEEIRKISKKFDRLTEIEGLIEPMTKYIKGSLDLDEIISLIEKNEFFVDTVNADNVTLLFVAIQDKRNDIALKLIDKGAADVNMINNDGQTALILAAVMGYSDVVLKLIENGADVNAKDNSGSTALMCAAMRSHSDVSLKLIENGADVNTKNNSGNTALIAAIIWGLSDVSLKFIENGADVNAKDNSGNTALIVATIWGDSEVALKLIENGADVNAKDNSGRTALMWAAVHSGVSDVALKLIEKGADVNAKDNSGNTALMAAAESGHIDVVLKLIEKGADINLKNKEGNTAKMLANHKGFTDLASKIEDKPQEIASKQATKRQTPLSFSKGNQNAPKEKSESASISEENEELSNSKKIKPNE